MLKTIVYERDFKRSIALLFALSLVHTIVLLCNLALPFGMVYGPFVYLAFKSAQGEAQLFSYSHILPFLILMFLYVLTLFGIELSISWAYRLTRFTYIEFYVIIPASLVLYSIYLLVSVHKAEIYATQKTLLNVLAGIGILYAAGLILSGLQSINVIRLSLNIKSLFFVFPLIYVFSVLFYLFTVKKMLGKKKSDAVVRETTYGDRSSNEIMESLMHNLVDNELYRHSAISLEMLSEKINVPRHHLSHFLNDYLGKSFYQLIAEYRVEYAKKRLKEDAVITIETLAYECGFNSKTSLNKYFKEVTGFAPSQYRTDANQFLK